MTAKFTFLTCRGTAKFGTIYRDKQMPLADDNLLSECFYFKIKFTLNLFYHELFIYILTIDMFNLPDCIIILTYAFESVI